MSNSKAKVTHKVVLSEIPIAKVRPRMSEEPAKQQVETENASSASPGPQKPARVRLVRPRLPEALAASPYATLIQPQHLPRSLSVAKTQSKSAGAKQVTPVKERISPTLSNVKSEALFSKLKLPHPSNPGLREVHRRKSNKDILNSTTCPKDFAPGEISSTLNMSFNSSFTASNGLPNVDSPHNRGSLIDAKTIESNFHRAVRDFEREGDSDLNRELDVYSQTFSEVIEMNPSCKSLLLKLKAKYETWIRAMYDRDRKSTSKYQSEVINLQNNLLREMEEKKSFARKIEKLAQENIELSRACESYQNKCFEYQEKLYEIANVKLDSYPPSEEAWKMLTSELMSYKSWKSKVMKELKLSQAKEKKLMELVHAMKKRGYPVEEIYNTEVKATLVAKQKKGSGRSEDSDMDPEPIVTGPAKKVPKPEAVPALRLEDVEREVSSASESEVSTEMYEASLRKAASHTSSAKQQPNSTGSVHRLVKAGLSGKSSKIVPQLTLPTNTVQADGGFHQEFMAKYDEFSESWRMQIDAQKH